MITLQRRHNLRYCRASALGLALPIFLLQLLPAHAATSLPAKEAARLVPVQVRVNPLLAGLDQMGNCATEIYDLAKGNRFERLPQKVSELKRLAVVCRAIQDESSSVLPRLDRALNDLERAVAAKNRADTMLLSNRVTLIATTLSVHLKPRIPAEVSLLEFNGRELEIWAEAKRLEKLSAIMAKMHLTWQMLMPKLINVGELKEMRKFSEIMGNLEGAKSADEYARLARQVLSAVSGMEGGFLKSK